MIVRECCVCGSSLGNSIDDGRPDVVVSHGYCQKHFDEAMIEMRATLAELEPDRVAA
jgi:hypothetical protein